MDVISKAISLINRTLMTIAGIFIFFSTLLTTVNSMMRYFLGSPISWADELSIYFIVLMVFLALPILEFTNDQLCISAILGLVKSEKGRKILVYIRGIISSILILTVSYYGFIIAKNSLMRNIITPVLMMPKGLLYAITAACFAFAAISWIVIMFFRKGGYGEC